MLAPVASLIQQKAAAGLAQRRLFQYEAADKISPCGPSQNAEDGDDCLIVGNQGMGNGLCRRAAAAPARCSERGEAPGAARRMHGQPQLAFGRPQIGTIHPAAA